MRSITNAPPKRRARAPPIPEPPMSTGERLTSGRERRAGVPGPTTSATMPVPASVPPSQSLRTKARKRLRPIRKEIRMALIEDTNLRGHGRLCVVGALVVSGLMAPTAGASAASSSPNSEFPLYGRYHRACDRRLHGRLCLRLSRGLSRRGGREASTAPARGERRTGQAASPGQALIRSCSRKNEGAHFGDKKMLSLVAPIVVIVAAAASALSAVSHE